MFCVAGVSACLRTCKLAVILGYICSIESIRKRLVRSIIADSKERLGRSFVVGTVHVVLRISYEVVRLVRVFMEISSK